MTLWQIYRRVLGASLLQARLAATAPRWCKSSASVALAAALTENLLEGDTLGIPAGDLLLRYLCGAPLTGLREAAAGAPPTRRVSARSSVAGLAGWAHAVDSACKLLPGAGQQQAALALGTALGARLHQTGALTVLLSQVPRAATPAETATPLGAWAQAASTATALQLPVLFVTESIAGCSPVYDDPRKPAPALPAIPVDRDDPLALYRVVYESAARARTGGGPTWIDCRALPSPLKRHAPAAVTPLASLEQVLRSRRLFTREQHRHMEHTLQRDLGRAGWSEQAFQ